MREENHEQMLKEVGERIKEMVKTLFERIVQEEQALYLVEHPTKPNGYSTRDLLTLAGPLEDLRVPRVREGDFHPQFLPYRRRTSLELSEAILALYACGTSTRAIALSWGIYVAFPSPQSISHLA